MLWKGTMGWKGRGVSKRDLVMPKKALLHYSGSSPISKVGSIFLVTCTIKRPHEMPLLQLDQLGRDLYPRSRPLA